MPPLGYEPSEEEGEVSVGSRLWRPVPPPGYLGTVKTPGPDLLWNLRLILLQSGLSCLAARRPSD